VGQQQYATTHQDIPAESEFNRFSSNKPVSEKECRLLVSALQCRGALCHFSGSLELLLKGKLRTYVDRLRVKLIMLDIPVIVTETEVAMKTPSKDIRLLQLGSPKVLSHHEAHHVFSITSPETAKEWCFDLTGTQFNIH
jgi:hypothetical protein